MWRSTPQKSRQILRHLRQCKVGVALVWLELDQHVDIAIGPEVVTEYGAEQGEPPDVMATAEVSDLLARDFDPSVTRCHGTEPGRLLLVGLSIASRARAIPPPSSGRPGGRSVNTLADWRAREIRAFCGGSASSAAGA